MFVETVRQFITKTADHFSSKKIENASFIAEKLLSDTLKIDRLQLYLELNRPLLDEEISLYREKIRLFLSSGNYQKDISVKQALSALKKIFTEANIPEPDINAEYIMAHVVQLKRLELKMMDDRLLNEDELKFLSLYKARKLKREPLEYILGYTEFYGRKFFVNRNTLIPRSETEQLIETFLTYSKYGTVLDIGTGTGCIPITLSLESSEFQLTSTDISEFAISVATKNNRALNADVSLVENDFLNEDSWELLGSFDHIISNPPYVTLDAYNNLEPEVKEFEPANALHDGGNGLAFYQKIISFAEHHLNGGGFIGLEIGFDQNQAILEMVQSVRYLSVIECKKDYAGHDRIIILQKRGSDV